VGKTAVARALAAAVGSRAHNIQGPMLRDPGVLAAWLTCARKHDVFFIDEIHAVPQGICELLYEVIDRRTLTLFVSRGTSTKTITIRLEPISIVGATTHLAEIPEAFRSRFTTRCAIDFYEIGNLEKIVERRAGEIGIGIDPVARHEVARASKGIPRQAIAILGHARDVTRVAGRTAIEAADVRQALRGHDIDAFGLEPTDRKVVEILQKARRPVSLGRLAAYVGLPIATLRDVVEPFLLRAGLVDVTARGRVAVG
jgi:Holliday junction DNA helicase RuvB